MTPDDLEETIARVALGDRAAFALLYDATSAKLMGIALRVLNERGLAEDALQEAYVKVWYKADTYLADGLSPMTWLITIVRNTAIDILRKRRTAADADVVSGPVHAPDYSPEAQVVARSEIRRINACMDELQSTHRDAVRGAYLQGHSYADLASRFDVPINTMRSWLRRSLLALKECLSR